MFQCDGEQISPMQEDCFLRVGEIIPKKMNGPSAITDGIFSEIYEFRWCYDDIRIIIECPEKILTGPETVRLIE